jgi:type IV secretion system protein VirD4
MQRARRSNPYPFTWEIPLAAALGAALALVLGVHAGRAVANLFAGGGPTFPPRADLFTSLAGVLRGDAAAGLDTRPGQLAGPAALWTCIALVELLVTAGGCWAAKVTLDRWGPGRLHGMATTAEAEKLLGLSRLRTVAPIVRPDLHPDGRRGRSRPWPGEPTDVGWQLGVAREPRGGRQLWVPWDRTAGVIGPQGSGKTLDLLIPALLAAPGAALVTLTKVDDLLLSVTARSAGNRPCVVLDPFGLAAGLPELVWDPIAGCVDPMVAERRAKAFTAGTVNGAVASGHGDAAARFYAAESAKVIQAFFHAAALTGRGLVDVLRWVANPLAASDPTEILREHPHAAPFWQGLLHGALHGDPRTAGNTITTVQQALSLFFQEPIRRRCVPGPGRPATDLAEVIRARGTIYLLGREDPYASASPLMTAVAEHVLDTALAEANASPHGRLCPPMLACLDELPSTAPLPTLRTRMANERALGISFIWAAQTRAQLSAIVGDQESQTLLGLTNNLVLFGGSKDVAFNQQISDLLGPVRVARTSWQTGRMGGRTTSGEDIPILTGAEVRQLTELHALVVAENGKPMIARLRRCIHGKPGAELLADQARARTLLDGQRRSVVAPAARCTAALVEAERRGLSHQRGAAW